MDTNQYYQENSEVFFESTVNVDVESLYEHFMKYVPSYGKILDLGCGSGRDTKAFLEKGYIVDAVDGSEELCRLASDYTGIKVQCMDFRTLDSKNKYDAIWACASLLHLPSDELPSMLTKINAALKDVGIVYMSFKEGEDEGWRDGRYFTDMTSKSFTEVLSKTTGFTIAEEWFSDDVRTDRTQKWYNVILRKE